MKWREACRRSDAYSQRVQAERLSKSTSSLPQEMDLKRKVLSPERPSPVRKRLRNRVSSEYRPSPSDEELLKRFEKVSTARFFERATVFECLVISES